MPDIYNASQEDAVAPQEDAIPTASAAKRDAVEAGLTESEANKKAKVNEEKTAASAVAPEPTSATSAEGPAPSPPAAASLEPATTKKNGRKAEAEEDSDESEDDLAFLEQENVIESTAGRRSTRNRPRPDYAALAKEMSPDEDEDDEDAVLPETGEEDIEIPEEDVEDDE